MIYDEVLSFYQESISGEGQRIEYLHQHINTALSFLAGIESSRAYRLAKKYAPESDFKELLKISIVLHDIGKVFYQNKRYNLRLDHEKGICYLTFAGHEYISAKIAYDFAFAFNEQYDNPYIDVVTFAVLHHHHAMGGKKNRVENLRKKLQSMTQSEYIECLDKLRLILNQLLTDYKSVLEKTLANLGSSPIALVDPAVHQKIYEKFVHTKKPNHRKLAFLLLDSLITCDYLAAEDRGGGVSHFHWTVHEFYNYWLRPEVSDRSEVLPPKMLNEDVNK